MSVEKIIQASVNKNPLAMKEALEEELRGRLALALEAKMKEDDMEDDMEESFDLSDLTMEELEDFMFSEDFDQLDEISKKTLGSYVKKATKQANSSQKKYDNAYSKAKDTSARLRNILPDTSANMRSIEKLSDKNREANRDMGIHGDTLAKRKPGIARATSRLAKESFDLSDLTLEELEDFMMSEDFDQLDEISKKKVADYMDKSHDEYKRLQQKGGAAGGSSVMNAKQKRRYATGSAASDNAFKKATGRARVNATD